MTVSAELRRRWRAAVLFALLVGLVGGVVLATMAGARRTGSALERFIDAARAPSVQVFLAPPRAAQLDRFRHAKDVVAVGVADAFYIAFPAAPSLNAAAPTDGALGTSVDRPRLIAGRLPNQRATDEVALGESLAAKLHETVGGHIDAVSYTPAQSAALLGGATDAGEPEGPRLRFRIVGIVRRPLDLGQHGGDTGVLTLTRAFGRTYAGRIGSFGTGLLVRTRHGSADLGVVTKDARHIFGSSPQFGVSSLASENNGAQHSIDVLAIALWIFAGVAALAGAVAIGTVLAREIARAGGEHEVLEALGASRAQRIAISVPVALAAGAAGALVAVIVAVAASDLFPIGVARRADPSLGLRVDPVVLVLGGLGILCFVAITSFVAARRVTGRRDVPAPRRPSKLADAVARSGLPPAVTSGVRMATQRGRDRRALPLASASVGAALGVLGVVAVLVFGANLGHVADTPRLSGWTWDFKASDTVSNETSCTRDDFGVLRESGVSALGAVCYGNDNITLDGRGTNGWAFVRIRGRNAPTIIAGRAPTRPNEVAVGAATLRALHQDVGGELVAKGPYGKGRYGIVGESVFPMLGQAQPLDDGAAFTGAGFAPLFDQNNFYRYLVGRVAPGADATVVERRIAKIPQLTDVSRPTVAVEIHRLQLVDWTPLAIALLLGLLAIVAVGNALVTSVRRRRHDLAVLKAVGFERRQVRATVAWQATTLACVGLVVGIPAGVVLGRFVWRLVADPLGIGAGVVEPVLDILLVVPATLVIVNLLAFFPARHASRTRPATVLRTE
jgi:ABC-type lipoprotein release transport system permease subunit